MKIFFIRNVPNNIPWPLKVLPVMPVTIFPRKTMKNPCFFSPVCHCGTLHSKSAMPCARQSTALWRLAARQLPTYVTFLPDRSGRRDLNGKRTRWFSDETFKNELIIRSFYLVNLRLKSLTKCNFGFPWGGFETCSLEANHMCNVHLTKKNTARDPSSTLCAEMK